MQKLIQAARDRGLETMVGEVLANNVRMLDLMKSLNFDIRKHPDDLSIVCVEYRLD